jgi:vitamin B12 transporter
LAHGQENQEGGLKLDPVTITATRTPRRVSTVGDSIEVFTKEQIDSLLPGDFIEVLQSATGAEVEQTGSRGGFTSFRVRGSEANFTSVLLDGFKINTLDGGSFNFANLSPEWIGQADLLRGPQSTLYGSDAAAGVLNLQLDIGRPGERPVAEASGRLGSFQTYEGTAKLRGGTEKTGYLASVSRVDTEGRFKNDGYYRTVGTTGFDYFLSDKGKIRLLYQINQNRKDNPSNFGATNTDLRLEAPFTDKELNAFTRELSQLGGLRLELRPVKWLEYIPRASIFEIERLSEDKADTLDITRPFFAPSKNDTTQTRYMVDNQVNLFFSDSKVGEAPNTASITTFGFEWEEERFFQKQRSSFNNSTSTARRRARSLYAQQQLTLWRDLTLTAGVRFDDFDSGEDPTTPKFSAAYMFRETGTKIRGAYAKGFKRPTFGDIFGGSFAGFSTIVGNPNLKSEEQENWEVGINQSLLSRKLQFNATYFNSELKDLIAFSFVSFPNGTNFENISKARLKGAEFSIALIDFRNFTIRANYNTLDTKVLEDRNGLGGTNFRQGEELIRRPNWWWSGSITYHPDRMRFTVRVNSVSSRRDLDFRPFVDGSNGGLTRIVNNPGYTKIDLAFAYDLTKNYKSIWEGDDRKWVKGLSIELKVNNLLDEDYDEVFGFSSPGINWFAGFRLFLS